MEQQKRKPALKRWIWAAVSVVIAGLTVYTVIHQSQDFSFSRFVEELESASVPYLLLAAVSAFLFVFFEGLAIRTVCRNFGFPVKVRSSVAYSSADIFFSAITPSAFGGQPACAYLMAADGVPIAFTAFALIVNLCCYVAAIVVIGILAVLVYPRILSSFGGLSRTLILLGIITQLVIFTCFLLLLVSRRIFRGICRLLVSLLSFLRLKKLAAKLDEKVKKLCEDFTGYTSMLHGKNWMLAKCFLYNFLQRISSIAVTAFCFLAMGGKGTDFIRAWAVQAFCTIGSNTIPIPGAMGVIDYLMLDGFREIIPAGMSVTDLELLSRAISFYLLIIFCGIVSIVTVVLIRTRTKRKRVEETHESQGTD